MVVLETPFNFYYETDRSVPISEFVESLQALEKLLHECPRMLNKLIPGLEMTQVEVDVLKIESGSLVEDLIIKLVFGSQEGLDRWCAEVRRLTGINAMAEKNPLLGPLVALLIVGGGSFAIGKMLGHDAPSTNIDMKNSVLIQNCAVTFNVTEDAVHEAVDAVQNKTNVASNVCKVLRPLRAEQGGNLIVDGYAPGKINQSVISEIPLKVTRDDAKTGTETLTNQVALVRAMDLDNLNKGWAATFPDVMEKRVRLKVAPGINPNALLRSDGVLVDVTLDYKFNDEGEKIYKAGYIERLVPSPDETP